MQFPAIDHHGGVRGVTGSCHQLHLDDATSLLIDCGLEQGAERQPGSRANELGFDVCGIRAVIVTHVHLDHVGRISHLFAAGFRGRIFCSEPSAKLLPLVLEDAYRLAISADPGQLARYVTFLQYHIFPIPFGQWHVVVERPGLSCAIRLQRAGHLLGSAYAECEVKLADACTRIVFSGDLGASDNPLLCPVSPLERADVLVMESTYGDRLHPDRSGRRQQLEAAIDRALVDHGTILIPAFSLGRTQELLYEIEDILHRKGLSDQEGGTPAEGFSDWARLPVVLDSPLAQRITQAYRELHLFWREEARERLAQGRDPLGFRQLVIIDTHARHQQVVNYLKSTGRPAIVIAGNGMCSGGRIVNYLKAMLGDPRHEVMFVGHQVKGTPGAVIQASEEEEGLVRVDLDGQRYEIRSKVMTLSGYSGHADQHGLVTFAMGQAEPAGKIVLVHGDDVAKRALADALKRRYRACGKAVEVEIP
ncbi:MBL fold metallo-hydrolase [Pseudomonas sp. microsymbiont 2]